MQSIFEIDSSFLEEQLSNWGQPPFHIKQIFQGVYQKYYQNWEQFTMLSKDLREKLCSNYSLINLQELKCTQSKDGKTQKYLFELFDGNLIESVLMQLKDRTTLCLSTQSGCAMGCAFCATGRMGFKRNLKSGEILEQVIFFQRLLVNEGKKTISNLVFMGMGEPFANYENLKNCLHILKNPNTLRFGSRHMTVSTIGIIPRIIDFSEDFPQVNLAVSLHAPGNDIRTNLVPINKTYPIEKLITACKDYIKNTNRRISFEYVLLNGINDDKRQAKELALLVRGMLCHVNLIAYNPINDSDYSPPDNERITDFSNVLKEYGINTTIRQSQGQEIQAGCGQLAGSSSANQ